MTAVNIGTFKKLGFSEKQAEIYLVLLALGPSSVRNLARKCELNRGVVYEALKMLREKNLVNLYEKNAKQYFVAEDPTKLQTLVAEQVAELKTVESSIKELVSELKSIYDKGGARPVARYFEKGEIKEILEDVLETCELTGEMEYRIYSDANLREYLYEGFETFSDARVGKGIAVRVIAIGSGGELRGLDERKYLKIKTTSPTYTLIYPGKTAYISLDPHGELVGVIIENAGIHETQKKIFDELWNRL